MISARQVRTRWEKVIEQVLDGEPVVVTRNRKPIVAIIPYEDFVVVQQQLEDLSDVRLAKAALAEYERDPSTAVPVKELLAELKA